MAPGWVQLRPGGPHFDHPGSFCYLFSDFVFLCCLICLFSEKYHSGLESGPKEANLEIWEGLSVTVWGSYGPVLQVVAKCATFEQG